MSYIKISTLEKYEKAIKLWGEHAQINMIIEESAELIEGCSKLIKHLMKLTRKNSDKQNKILMMFVCEEIADLEIMLEQAHLIFDGQMIDQIKREKIENLGKRLNL